jgi:tRNA threonylcarbamoyl adenosine modification protein (Sua5/YciO/YrdC/YwlC family)
MKNRDDFLKTAILKTETDLAVKVLQKGGLVAVPTETVYGLSANGLDSKAVAKIYEVKGRPETKPINLLVYDMKNVEKFCVNIPEDAYKLAELFWPGPLTMILQRNHLVPDIVTAGGETVGVRCPDHDITREIIQKAGIPLATPSANLSGQPSPKNAQQVIEYFDGKIECIVDGGQCSVGVESTIVDMTKKPYRVLRIGGLSLETVRTKAGIEVVL